MGPPGPLRWYHSILPFEKVKDFDGWTLLQEIVFLDKTMDSR